MSNAGRDILYIGVTNDLIRRTYEHREGRGCMFTKKYALTYLVYYEHFHDIDVAIAREKALKGWKRTWKQELIGNFNPTWRDLYHEII